MITKSELRMLVRQEINAAIEPITKKLKADEAFKEKRYLTIKEVAEYLSIGVSTVHYWVKEGKLKKHYIKGAPRFDKYEIDQEVKGNNKTA
jgi:excisionase family DNA binding protein